MYTQSKRSSRPSTRSRAPFRGGRSGSGGSSGYGRRSGSGSSSYGRSGSGGASSGYGGRSGGGRSSYGRPGSGGAGGRPGPRRTRAYTPFSDRQGDDRRDDRANRFDRPRSGYGDRPHEKREGRRFDDRPRREDDRREGGFDRFRNTDRRGSGYGRRDDRGDSRSDERFAAPRTTWRDPSMRRPSRGDSRPGATQDTSWEVVADWYDTLLETDTDSYQQQVVAPNLIRMMHIEASDRIVDLGCGQGFFSHLFAEQGAKVTGVDASPELVARASERQGANTRFVTAPADMTTLQDASADVITIVLALQNMDNIHAVFKECARVLAPRGRMYIVLNHPNFRIPQHSDWVFDKTTGLQSRRISRYLSDAKIKIDMTPGKTEHKIFTWSFHRPLQSYIKHLFQAGFVTCRMEEWASHKKSQPGPRAQAEDAARKEIPLFLCIEVRKLSSFYNTADQPAQVEE